MKNLKINKRGKSSVSKFVSLFLWKFFIIIPVYAEPLLITSLKERLWGPKFLLKEVIQNSAATILEKAQQEKTTIQPGRKTLLLEMLKDPAQLAKDLPRIPKIQIGPHVISTSWRKGKSAEQQFDLTKALLINYIKDKRPMLIDPKNPKKIGQFEVEEIIYGIVQGFSAFALELAHGDPVIRSGKWAAVAQSATQYAIIALENSKAPFLSVSFQCEKKLVHANDSTKRAQKLITQSKLLFDFSQHEVKFFFGYSLNNRGSVRYLHALPNI